MRKLVMLSMTLMASLMVTSQNSSISEAKETVINFFEAFHNQDSTGLRSLVKEGIVMQSIGKNREGSTVLNTTDFDKFVTSIASIPKENTFKETLLDFSIQVDGDMANVWTPYEFYYNGTFSHCGVNSFQLIRENGEWKIFFLVDTRRKDDCKKS